MPDEEPKNDDAWTGDDWNNSVTDTDPESQEQEEKKDE